MRVLLTGGGTAGHINPAIAIANYIKEKEPDSEFLFVGTQRGLEKEKNIDRITELNEEGY